MSLANKRPPNPNLVTPQQLNEKPETVHDNLDRSLFVFSKKQIILPSAGITEFYTIKLRYPFVEDGQQVTMLIQP